MPDHVRAKNLGLVRPVPVMPQAHGRLVVGKTDNGGLLFRLVGPGGDHWEELSAEESLLAGQSIIYLLDHGPMLPPPEYGRLKIDKSPRGGISFRIRRGSRDGTVELAVDQARQTGNKIVEAMGHPPIVSPPDVD